MFLTLKVTTARPVQIFASAEKEKIDVEKKCQYKGYSWSYLAMTNH